MFEKLRDAMELAGSVAASTARGWRGTSADIKAKTPEKRLKLYEFEACPFCRLTREVLTELHLDAEIYPCPKGGTRFRPEAEAIAGKEQFPLLIDPNTGAEMLESADINKYLVSYYGSGSEGPNWMPRPLQVATSGLASALRPNRGMTARPSRAPEQLLELWSFESSPFSRPVREVLCELELPYVLHNLGKEQFIDMGPPTLRPTFKPYAPVPNNKRAAFLDATGKMQVPYLFDPNTGIGMFESKDIVAYLEETYGA